MCQSFAKGYYGTTREIWQFYPYEIYLNYNLTFRSFENFETHNQKSLFFFFKIISFFYFTRLEKGKLIFFF